MAKTKQAPALSRWEKVFSAGDLYTLEEVAEKVKGTPRQVRRWTDEGRLEFIKLPQGRRILGQTMIDFLSGRTVEPEGD